MKLDKITSWKNRYKENLVDLGTFQDIEEIKNDERLKSLLDTPLGEIINKGNELGHTYSHAFIGDWENFYEEPLKNIFREISKSEQGKIKFYISEGKEIEGLIFYTIKTHANKKYVWDIFTISFNLDKNSLTLAKDLYILFLQLRNKYDFIRWEADSENPSCVMYKKICEKYGGEVEVLEEDDNILVFKIPGKKENSFNEAIDLSLRNFFLKETINEIFKESLLNHFLRRYLK